MQFTKKFTVEQPEVYRGGGAMFDLGKGWEGMQKSWDTQWSSVTKGDIGAIAGDMYEGHKYVHDPVGLFGLSDQEGFKEMQQSADIFSQGARPREEAEVAEKAAKKQQAAIAKQQTAIEKKRKAQQAVIDERASRMAKNQLLTGKETGITNGSTSLLKG